MNPAEVEVSGEYLIYLKEERLGRKEIIEDRKIIFYFA